jgi:hypothetical protein
MPRFPEWRTEHDAAKYPFEDACDLVTDTGFTLPSGIFLDASLYARGGGANARIDSLTVAGDRIKISVTDDNSVELSGEFFWNSNDTVVKLLDEFGRPAGMLITEPLRMAALQAWGDAAHTFGTNSATFVASVSSPMPETSVSGIVLDDGNVLTGDVILVADDGVMFSCDTVLTTPGCGIATVEQSVIRVNAVGNPLFLRQRCEPSLFRTPQFLRSLVFQKGDKRIEVGPGETGRVLIAQVPVLVEDTVLRLSQIENGLRFEAVGERTDGGGNGG